MIEVFERSAVDGIGLVHTDAVHIFRGGLYDAIACQVAMHAISLGIVSSKFAVECDVVA